MVASELEELLEGMKSRLAFENTGNAKSGAERRQHKRVKSDVGVACSTSAGTELHRAIDISMGGVSLEAEDPPSVGERTYMTMCVSTINGFAALKAIGQVVWARRRVNGSMGAYGVLFSAINPEAKRAIDDYINKSRDAVTA